MAASWFSIRSPINSFPDYHGPHEVGTVDVEIPAVDIPAPCPTPEDAQPTIAFRIFYPCMKPSSGDATRPVRWIPQPQRLTIAALMKFLGMRERTAGFASYLTQHLHWINLKAYRNASLLEPPTSNGRWPVTFFSHGLAGSRNAYSYICGDLASNGMIVVALDHRDGSSPVQYVRATADSEAHVVHAQKIRHEPCNEVFHARDKQLRIRLWELATAYEALMKIDGGQDVENLDGNTSQHRQERVEVLRQFDGKLDIHRAGKVSWAGHSFGAATITQLVKSILYSSERSENDGVPLIKPNPDAAILHQIMIESLVLLLDLWGLPLRSPDQNFLWERSLGDNVLAVLSEAFRNWKDNLNINKHIVTPSSSRRSSGTSHLARDKSRVLPTWARLRDASPSRDSGYISHDTQASDPPLARHASRASDNAQDISASIGSSPERPSKNPRMFFVQRSQHFNQSDFGILFPFLARRLAKAEEPEQVLELNTRAMVQTLREAGIEVAGEDDREILDASAGIPRWVPIPLDESEKTIAGNSEVNGGDSNGDLQTGLLTVDDLSVK